MPKSGDERYLVKPVRKALQILVVFGTEQRAMTLTEICHRVRLPKTTVYRYLRTLVYEGFVAQDTERDVYHLGGRLFELVQIGGERRRLRSAAVPVMAALRDRFNETVNLGVLEGYDVVYLEMAETSRALRMQAALGGRDPAYSTALGKAILACLDGLERQRHVPKVLAARTLRTHVSHSSLTKELDIVARLGYAVDEQENEDGARCIGAPVFAASKRVVGAISLAAPATRLRPEMVADVAAVVAEAAADISNQLA